MLHTMELVLGIEPMSEFDANAEPMWGSFQGTPNLATYTARSATIDLNEKNPAGTRGAKVSSSFDFSKEDLIDDIALNQVVWKTVKGEKSKMPAPIHSAYVRTIKHATDSDGDDD